MKTLKQILAGIFYLAAFLSVIGGSSSILGIPLGALGYCIQKWANN